MPIHSYYPDVATGRAAVANGEQFWVFPTANNSHDFLTLYERVDASTETKLYTQFDPFMVEAGTAWGA